MKPIYIVCLVLGKKRVLGSALLGLSSAYDTFNFWSNSGLVVNWEAVSLTM
jgi:hypothetical protein